VADSCGSEPTVMLTNGMKTLTWRLIWPPQPLHVATLRQGMAAARPGCGGGTSSGSRAHQRPCRTKSSRPQTRPRRRPEQPPRRHCARQCPMLTAQKLLGTTTAAAVAATAAAKGPRFRPGGTRGREDTGSLQLLLRPPRAPHAPRRRRLRRHHHFRFLFPSRLEKMSLSETAPHAAPQRRRPSSQRSHGTRRTRCS